MQYILLDAAEATSLLSTCCQLHYQHKHVADYWQTREDIDLQIFSLSLYELLLLFIREQVPKIYNFASGP